VTVNSINSLFFGVMMGGGLFLTPFVLDLANGQWRVTFYLFGGSVLFLTVIWMMFARERRDSGRGKIQQQELPQSTGIVASALKHRDMWVAGFGMVGAGLVWSAFMSFFPTFALETHDISLRWSGAILASSMTTGGLAGLAAAYLLRSNNFRREILIVLGICVAGGYAAMTLIGSPSLLMIVAFVAGVGGGYFPVLYSVPFQIPVRHPKQVSVGIAFILTSLSLGTVLGPLITGYLQEMFGRLDISLLIVSLAGLSICISGILLSPLRQSNISGKTPT
jgi:MFS family permease